mmetsp:Transcript_49090/g.92004  ORF Transcript_49090/g.92004 Transcript_49090/m.92004 type:complete len:260 (-) Transcript_49090:61-840(-)
MPREVGDEPANVSVQAQTHLRPLHGLVLGTRVFHWNPHVLSKLRDHGMVAPALGANLRPLGQAIPPLLAEALGLGPRAIPVFQGQPMLLQLVLRVQFIIAAVDEPIEAFHLPPALEVLHPAMAIAGDHATKVTLKAGAHLHPLHGIIEILRVPHGCPHLVLLLATRNCGVFAAAVWTHLLVVAQPLALGPAELVSLIPGAIRPGRTRQGIFLDSREAFRILLLFLILLSARLPDEASHLSVASDCHIHAQGRSQAGAAR